ncbi:MAG: hypothetical protein Q8922_11965 [Bacteroidota bacterium]|nr:hypothetical protein [Bacteroidota bacterium]MDP4233299.1 hypothetical protein [Bacteroidota bacterium]MDP4242081.1 hypothetical protein [Bacteroidota bacterium]MDP4288640.1 hypothetical protein [Bacteroidota bacterium]
MTRIASHTVIARSDEGAMKQSRLDSISSLAMTLAVLVFTWFVFTNSAFAQGSTYNFFGFGTPLPTADPTIEGLGGTGVALQGTRVVNVINPADWNWLTRARFNVALRYDYANDQLGGITEQQHNITLSGISFGVPFWSEHSAALALGYVPLTDASGKIEASDSMATKTYVRRGGANMLFLGAGMRLASALAIGARLDLITGNIRHQDHLAFTDLTQDSAEYERDYLFNGLRPTFGIELIGDSIADGLRGLTIGASYSLGASLTATRETIITPISSTLDTTIDESGKGYYPSSFAAGISYHFSYRYRAEVDYSAQNFASAYVFAPLTSSGDPSLRNGSRISVGVERLPNISGEFGTSFGLDRWGLRLGFAYSQLPIEVAGFNFSPNGTGSSSSGGVTELALSAGLGIPLSFETLMNLSLTVGQRNPTDASVAPKETFLRLGASVSLSDKWFVPTRRE